MNFADTAKSGKPVDIQHSTLNKVLSDLISSKHFGTMFTPDFLRNNGIVVRQDMEAKMRDEWRFTFYVLPAADVFKNMQTDTEPTAEFLETNCLRKLVFLQNELTCNDMCVFHMYVKKKPPEIESWMMPGLLEEMAPVSSSMMANFLVNSVVPPPAVPYMEKPYGAASGNGTVH